MSPVREILRVLAEKLSEKNYDESFAQYRFWLDIGITHGHIASRDIDEDGERIERPASLEGTELIHPTARLLVRFIGDMEADQMISRHALGVHERHCTSALRRFFDLNLSCTTHPEPTSPVTFLVKVNLIAHWSNLGYVEEAVIRDHILQSLISHPKLYNHQADALVILFKLAGATFEAYADPSVVDRCFELLKGHSFTPIYNYRYPDYHQGRMDSVQVRPFRVVNGNRWAEAHFQEVIALREGGWEGLHPPPVFTTGKHKSAGMNRKDPSTAPVVASLGLPNGDLEPQTPQPESIIAPEPCTTPASPATPATQSPSISIAALSDFTIPDAPDDEPPTGPTFADIFGNEPFVDATGIGLHETFYLEDGNVEVLCGDTLFRVHASTLSFHSAALRRMFAQTSLVAAESPNGCPRILSSDPSTDFVTLLKIVYLPEYAACLDCNEFFR